MADPVKTVDDAMVKTDDDLNDALVESVQAKLDAINGVTDDKDVVKVADKVEDKQADDDAVDDDPTPDVADDDATDDDPTPEVKAKDGDKTTEEVLLPDAFYRAAVHQGWEPDDIKEFFEANPEKAMKTFAKIHESTNKLSSEFARLGRVGTKPADKVADTKPATGDIDLAAIKEQYGDDSAVVKALEIMQTKLNSIQVQPPVQDNRQAADDPALATVNKFFTDPALKPYVDFYGAGKDRLKLTQEQEGHRWSLLEMADNIILGSQAQGRGITVEEAMEAAHLLVSEPVREKALRAELKAKVQKRAKGVSLKPAKSKTAKSVTDNVLTEQQRVAKVAAGLRHVFR